MPSESAQAVVLRELGGAQRELRLEDTTLPEQGVVVETEQRTTATWYPGASTASVQVHGTKEAPIPFVGWLRDSWLGLEGGAAEIGQQLRALSLGRQRCELSWGESLVRRGRVQRVRLEYTREADIRYEFVFEPDEADESAVIAVAANRVPAPSQFELADVLDVLSDALDLALKAAAVSNAINAIF
jgi:hypothetical protein